MTAMNSFDFLASVITNRHIEQGVLFAELNAADYDLPDNREFFPVFYLVVAVIVLDGTMEVTIDHFQYKCTACKNNFVSINPVNTIQYMNISSDFRGYILVLPKRFLESATHGEKPIPFSEVISARRYPVISVNERDMGILKDYFRIVADNAGAGDSPLEQEIFRNAVLLLHSTICRIKFGAVNNFWKEGRPSRAATICNRFFELLMEHIKEEHEVNYYADALNITPHYLTRITKKYTGLSANRLITKELLTQTELLLHDVNYTLQQIADLLHFCDQSSFGKFFKKHTGMTPTAYRRNLRLCMF